MPADVIGLEEPSLLLHHVDGLRMVFHVEPVSYIFAVPVYRKLFSFQRIVDHQRNQLFRKLIRSVVIRTVRDIGREMIGIHIGLYEQIAPRLGGTVGTVRCIGRRFVEITTVLRKRTVDLVRGHMEKLLIFLKTAVLPLPCLLCRIQHGCRSKHIGFDKYLRVENTPIHMGFRCKMHDTVNLILCKNLLDGRSVTDIRLDKGIIVLLLHLPQIFRISRIGQGIHVNDADLLPVFAKHIEDVVGADKSGASGNQISSHKFSLLKSSSATV